MYTNYIMFVKKKLKKKYDLIQLNQRRRYNIYIINEDD